MACITQRRGRLVIDFYDQNGKRRWKTLPAGITKKKAREELRAIEDQVERRVYLPERKIPLFSEVAKDWLEYKKPKVRITTWEVLEGHTRNHFSELNNLKMNRITTVTVEKFITKRQELGMNIGTLRKILVTLGQIFRYAVRHKIIEHNPLADAERPMRGRGNHEDEGKEMRILTPDQIKELLAKVEGQKYKVLFLMAIFTGARQGELLGLRWKDIEWENKQVHIQRTFNKGRFFTTKTKGSNRRIDLAPMVIKSLKEWRLACPKDKLGLIFPNKAGNPMNYSNMMNRQFFPALKAAKVPKIRFHDLRVIAQ